LLNDDLHKFMQEASRGMSSMVGIMEDLPLAENRIELADQKDKYGMRLAKALHTWHPETRKLWDDTAKEGMQIVRAAGAKQAWHSPPGDNISWVEPSWALIQQVLSLTRMHNVTTYLTWLSVAGEFSQAVPASTQPTPFMPWR